MAQFDGCVTGICTIVYVRARRFTPPEFFLRPTRPDFHRHEQGNVCGVLSCTLCAVRSSALCC